MGACCSSDNIDNDTPDPLRASKWHLPHTWDNREFQGYVSFAAGHRIEGTFNTDWGFPLHGTIQLAGEEKQEAHFRTYPYGDGVRLAYGNYLIGSWGSLQGVWGFRVLHLPVPRYVIEPGSNMLLTADGVRCAWSADRADAVARDLCLKSIWRRQRFQYAPPDDWQATHRQGREALAAVLRWCNQQS